MPIAPSVCLADPVQDHYGAWLSRYSALPFETLEIKGWPLFGVSPTAIRGIADAESGVSPTQTRGITDEKWALPFVLIGLFVRLTF